MKKILFVLTVAFTLTITHHLNAQPGSLDNIFGTGGKVTTSFGSTICVPRSVIVQPDGKIVVGGEKLNAATMRNAIARYNNNGTLDNMFGTGGKISGTYGPVSSLILQPDGKILAAGYFEYSSGDYRFYVARYNSNGSSDITFAGGAVVTNFGMYDERILSAALQTDGKIVVAGYSTLPSTNTDFTLVRYNNNGVIDSAFGTNGKIMISFGSCSNWATAVALQCDGKIVAGGVTGCGGQNDYVLARFKTNGSFDSTFNSIGKVTTSFSSSDMLSSIAIQPDGKIVAAGYCTIGVETDFALSRYNSNGGLDGSFGIGGKVITDFEGFSDYPNSVVIQKDGKIIAAGSRRNVSNSEYDFALVRYNSNGSLDATFGIGGKINTAFGSADDNANSVAIQNDGKIVAVGQTYIGSTCIFALARYTGANVIGSITVSDSIISCQVGSVTLTASQGSSYLWSTSETTQSINATTAGNYSVVVTDACGSGNPSTINIMADPLPIVSLVINPDTVCLNTSAYALSGGSPSGGTYSGTGVGAGNFNPTIAGNGLHNIFYSYTDVNNCTNTDTSQIYVDLCTSIESSLDNQTISVAPNPFFTQTTLQTDDHFKDATLMVYNSFGQTVKQIDNLSSQTIIFHRDNLSSGLYFIRITQDSQVIATKKLLITD